MTLAFVATRILLREDQRIEHFQRLLVRTPIFRCSHRLLALLERVDFSTQESALGFDTQRQCIVVPIGDVGQKDALEQINVDLTQATTRADHELSFEQLAGLMFVAVANNQLYDEIVGVRGSSGSDRKSVV